MTSEKEREILKKLDEISDKLNKIYDEVEDAPFMSLYSIMVTIGFTVFILGISFIIDVKFKTTKLMQGILFVIMGMILVFSAGPIYRRRHR